ncbi:MAG: glycosyltransferase [Alphaproteobacteria bacterium]|nr:glycosyltransferase [Alphaproteobacteria bacterium]
MGKIAFVLKGYPRLSETFIAQEILGLEKTGLDLHLYSLRHPTDARKHPIHKEISAPVTYLPEYLYREPVRLIRAWKYVRALQSYQSVFSLWFNDLKRDFTPNRIRRFGQAVVLAAELPAEITHLHAHFLHTPTSVTRYTAHLLGIPWSVSAHAVDIWTTPDWEKREKLQDCSWATSCSQMAVENLQSLAPTPEKVTLIYHGLDLERFPATPQTKSLRDGTRPDDPIQIVTVGRAVEKKGHDVVIAALSSLPKELHWRWTHIGGGELVTSLKKQATAAGLNDRIEWRGSLPQQDVIDTYQRADLFVLANRIAVNGDRDGLPNVLMEAQSQKLACIASNEAAVPELIEDGVNGYLVTPEEPQLFAEKIAYLIKEPLKRVKMGEAGRKIIEERFSHLSGIEALALKFSAKIPSKADFRAPSPQKVAI